MKVHLGSMATHNALIKVMCSPPRKGLDFIIMELWREGTEWIEGINLWSNPICQSSFSSM